MPVRTTNTRFGVTVLFAPRFSGAGVGAGTNFAIPRFQPTRRVIRATLLERATDSSTRTWSQFDRRVGVEGGTVNGRFNGVCGKLQLLAANQEELLTTDVEPPFQCLGRTKQRSIHSQWSWLATAPGQC